MPLKGIPRIIPPKLLMTLAEMGHGDEIVIGDANFPAVSTAEAKTPTRLIDMTGHSGLAVVEAILQLFPLDQYVPLPAAVMARVPSDVEKKLPVPIWDQYLTAINNAEGRVIVQLEEVERFAFYERAKKAFAVVVTGEGAQYANLILKKGVLIAEKPSATATTTTALAPAPAK